MVAKQISFGADARVGMARGASILAQAVKATLGPRDARSTCHPYRSA